MDSRIRRRGAALSRWTTTVLAVALAACTSGHGATNSSGSNPSTTILSISGIPAASVAVGDSYSFQPAVRNSGGGAITFSVQNAPAWTTFDSGSGLLSGTPVAADVHNYAGIVITVNGAAAQAELPAFSITVTQATAVDGACGAANGTAVVTGPTAALCSTGTASVVSGSGPWFWTCAGSGSGTSAQCSAQKSTLAPAPRVRLHYAPNANFDSQGNYLPASAGFNLADVSSAATLTSLPAGVLGLVWLGMCQGADSAFIAAVTAFEHNAKLFGFYLMDEPDPTGKYATVCTAANLRAESDWIHANLPGAKTFIVMMNLGTPTRPDYMNTYNPGNTGIDLYGLDPYPVRQQLSGGADYSVIGAAVSAASAAGIPVDSMIPVFQAFGGGGYTSYTLPTSTQEQQILSVWTSVLAHPVFDYAYSWGPQSADQALATSPDLQGVFAGYNATH